MDVGSYSSVVRALVAKARGPGFNSLVNAWDFSLSTGLLM